MQTKNRNLPPALRELMPAESKAAKPEAMSPLKQSAMFIVIALAVMWGMEVLDLLLPDSVARMDSWGVRPRTAAGLIGIPLAPFLHGGFGHLISNTIPFAILGFLVMLRGGAKQWVLVTAVTTIAGGLLVWTFAASGTSHIGASGVVFGYGGYLIARGIFERSLAGIAIAGFVCVMYGTTLLFGLLPTVPGVSWEGHLFGAVAGIGWAFATHRKKKARS